MNNCSKCGQNPCGCSPAVLANVQLVNSLLTNPTLDGPTMNGGTANDLSLIGATLDCTSRGCTAGTGQCNDGIATNAFVCNTVANAISDTNPAFCAAVTACLGADPAALCSAVATCIATTPGIINTTSAFGIAARATTALWGVVRFATENELNNGACLLAIDPCTLIAALTTPNLASPLWVAFTQGVCNAGSSCFVSSNSPVFTGDPQAPTPPPGDNDNSLATTAFVNTAINNAISGSNPAFCTAVAACAGATTCGQITALFPAAGGNPPGSTRFLGTDCLSYTAAQIVAGGGGGGGGGGGPGGGCIGMVTTFTGPWRTQENFAAWIGADSSAGAGFTQAFIMSAGACPSSLGMWTAIPDSVAQQIRAGVCQSLALYVPTCESINQAQ